MSQLETKTSKTTINQKIQKLDQMVEWFYGEDFNLDQALVKYQEAKRLAKEINQNLDQLKNEVKIIADLTKDDN